MDEEIIRGAERWRRLSNGSWTRWNPSTSGWEASASPPPPPPPPVAPTGQIIIATGIPTAGPRFDLRGRPFTIVGAAFLVVLLAAVVTWGGLLDAVRSQPKEAPPPAVGRVGEANIYEAMGDWSRCVKDPRGLVGTLIDRRRDRPGLQDDLARVTDDVAQVRKLEPRKKIRARFVAPGEVGRLVATEFDQSYKPEKARLDEKVLVALGAIKDGVDLRATSRELVEEQVLGYYSLEEKRLIAGSKSGKLRPMDEMILAHEIAHAIVDDRIGLPDLGAKNLDPDRGLARRALVEGDANLAMTFYLMGSRTPAQLMKIGQRMTKAASSVQGGDPDTPYILRRALAFPYEEGMAFACRLFSKGGWSAVDTAYDSPPASTAEILFPERYGVAEPPLELARPGKLGAGWKKVDSDTMGPAALLMLFQSPGGKAPPSPGHRVNWVAGWNGDRIDTWQRGSDIAILMTVVDGGVREGRRRTEPLCGHLETWQSEAFPERTKVGRTRDGATIWRRHGGFASVTCDPGRAHFAFAPDRRTVMKVLKARPLD